MSNAQYRGRLAPSPTGYLHVGHARTFWVAQERAQAAGGVLVLRNEDIDATRAKMNFVEAMLEDMRWLGLRWQEGPDCGGPFGPYEQSKRRPFYEAAFKRLEEGGWIYPCRCTRGDVLRALQAPHATDEGPIYPGTCRPERGAQSPVSVPSQRSPAPGAPERGHSCPQQASQGGRPCPVSKPVIPSSVAADRNVRAPGQAQHPHAPRINWRFRVPDGESIEFMDGGFGPQRFVAGKDFGDFVIWRHDDMPSYQLSVVVDDAAMQITEVVRGADLLLSTARQLLLYRALGATPPAFYHCPLMTDEHGVRLAKRHDALSLRKLRQQGLSPEEVRERFIHWERRHPAGEGAGP